MAVFRIHSCMTQARFIKAKSKLDRQKMPFRSSPTML